MTRPPPALLERAAVVLRLISGVVIVALMLATVLDVLGRQLFSSGIEQTIEVTEVALVVVAFVGMAGALVSGTHATTTIVTSHVRPRFASSLRILGGLTATLFLAWACWHCAELAVDSYTSGEHRFGLTRVPMWPARAAVAFGFGSMAVVAAIKTLGLLADHRAGTYAVTERVPDAVL